MSEISSGVLVRSGSEDRLKQLLTEGGIDQDTGFMHRVNTQWTGLFLADEYLSENETLSMLLDWSDEVPLLFLLFAEDAGWAARVLNHGRTEFEAEVRWDDRANVRTSGQFSAFTAFGISTETVRVLGKLFTDDKPEVLRQEGFSKFKELMEFSEFEWMSYRYLIDEVLNEGDAGTDESSMAGAHVSSDGTEQQVRENLDRLARSLVSLIQEFLDTHDDTVPLGFDQRMCRVKAEFTYYQSLEDEMKHRYAETTCAVGLKTMMLTEYGEKWRTHLTHFDQIWPEVRSLFDRFSRELGGEPFYYVSPTQHPRGKRAVEMIQQIILQNFPERNLKSTRRQRVSLGPLFGCSRMKEAYLFPKVSDPNDVLWIEFDQDNFSLTGGFGRAEWDFYVPFALPCLGWGGYEYAFMLETYDLLEKGVRAFCRALEIVYPYHMRLWEANFG